VRKAIEGAGLMGPSANRITLVRDVNSDGKREVHETFLAGLNQPFGMLLLGEWLYVANTKASYCLAVLKLQYSEAPPGIDQLP
jgi:glucose/arabinose dehydrogenase